MEQAQLPQLCGCVRAGCVYVILEEEGVLGGIAGFFRKLGQALSKLLHRS